MNQQLLRYLTNGGLLKTLGIICLFLFTIGAGSIAGYDILTNQPISPIIATYLSFALTSITHMVNLAQTSGLISSAVLINPMEQEQKNTAQPANADNAASA